MTYDLAVWEGRRPLLNRTAATTFLKLLAQLGEAAASTPASPAIADFVADVVSIWPDLGSPGDENSPWASGPLIGEASGSFIYVPLTPSAADAAVPVLSRIAQKRRLVCYDPQAERLL